MHSGLVRRANHAVPLHAVTHANLKTWMSRRTEREARWLSKAGFVARNGEIILVPATDGSVASVVLDLGKGEDPLALAAFSESLPPGTYELCDVPLDVAGARAAL